MEAGNLETRISPIVEAIAAAEHDGLGEIRVHVTRRPWEKDAFARAQRLFLEFGMERTQRRNAVLIYVNLRRHRFAIVADAGWSGRVPPQFWDKLAHGLRDDLLSTQYERAISFTVARVGAALHRLFPPQ